MQKYLFLIAFPLLISACEKGQNIEDSFNRKEMLQEVAQQLIKPAFTLLKSKTDSLVSVTQTFTQNSTSDNLVKLQQLWERSYLAYLSACAYNFGQAGEEGTRKALVEEVATFPVSTTKIESAITNNNANFNDFNRDARGLLTLEYLIFDLSGNQTTILNNFQSTNRKTFLTNLVANIKIRVDAVVSGWEGNYLQEFINNDGTSAGSSTSLLYNEFVKSFEALKNFKVALPLGKRAGQTQTEPTKVEAYYSGTSIKMLKAHFATLEAIWRKFIPYLQSVEGGNGLIASTEAQLTLTKNALNTAPETLPFATQIQNAPTSFDTLHTELQKMTRFFKSDMSSVLGIAITYSSGDGD
jgi:hypothetical protein